MTAKTSFDEQGPEDFGASNATPRATAVKDVELWSTRIVTLSGARFVLLVARADDPDLIVTEHGRVLVFSDEQALRRASLPPALRQVGFEVGGELDVRAAQRWLRTGGALDASTGVDLWNLAEDVLRSAGRDRLTAGEATDGLHAKLTGMALPYLFPGMRRSWTPFQLRRLHVVLTRADRVVRSEFRTEQDAVRGARP